MSDRLDRLAANVDEWLLRLGLGGEVTDEGFWLARFGSSVVMISVFEDERNTYVRCAAIVVSGANSSLDLVLRLLRLNSEVLVGAFQLFDDQSVAFTHTMVGEGLGFEGFEPSLLYVARVADDHDEELQSMAGGERAEDLIEGEPRR